MASDQTILLFPPNWTSCSSGPHLAGLLLAGAAESVGWSAEVWDLTAQFCRSLATPPSRVAISDAVERRAYETLDKYYFDWEDQMRAGLAHRIGGAQYGLLSGCTFSEMHDRPLRDVIDLVRGGTVFSKFIRDSVLPRIEQRKPSVIGVTIASQQQIIPAIELLLRIRETFEDIFLVLGGNIVTRLKGCDAFDALASLADHTVLYQGERAFASVLNIVKEVGPERARKVLPSIAGDESLPHELWPVPNYAGIDFDQYIGTPTLSYVSTRGCYWGRCHFCAIPAGWSRSGYGGSAPADYASGQLAQMVSETGISRVKFVDEAMPPAKVLPLANQLAISGQSIEWEAYARLEPAFEDSALLAKAYAGGLRKLYFGLEQSPKTDRRLLNKNDGGDASRILRACEVAGIKVHLFCMVGFPGTSLQDADETVRFLIDNQESIDTADLVGFRLDRGATVPGVRAVRRNAGDWAMSMPFVPEHKDILGYEEVCELEGKCQETIWEAVPRLLHPLYRVVGPWASISPSLPVTLPEASHTNAHATRA